jgi:hypothetical protein
MGVSEFPRNIRLATRKGPGQAINDTITLSDLVQEYTAKDDRGRDQMDASALAETIPSSWSTELHEARV